MKAERFEGGPMQYKITGIKSDMGESTVMDLVIQNDGDALITLKDTQSGVSLELEICTFQGGTRNPGLAGRLREVAEYLYRCQQDPNYAGEYMMKRLMEDRS